MEKFNQFSCEKGILVTGGQSKRMGTPKQWLQFANRPLLMHSYDRLSTVCQEVVVITNDVREEDRMQSVGYATKRDVFANQGPLAGLHAGLVGMEPQQIVLLLACDMPFMRAEVLHDLVGQLKSDPHLQAVVPREEEGGRLFPVCAAYRADVRTVAEEHLQHGENAMRRFLAKLQVKYIRTERWANGSPDPFFNMNTPEDYERACTLWTREGWEPHE